MYVQCPEVSRVDGEQR